MPPEKRSPAAFFMDKKKDSPQAVQKELNPATTYSPGPLPAKYHQRAEA